MQRMGRGVVCGVSRRRAGLPVRHAAMSVGKKCGDEPMAGMRGWEVSMVVDLCWIWAKVVPVGFSGVRKAMVWAFWAKIWFQRSNSMLGLW